MLVVNEVSHSFGQTVALNNVSFTANPGKVLAIVGENGSGKSTLLRILACELRPQSGNAMWEGVRLDRGTAPTILVHQELALCPDLTVAENVHLGMAKGVRFSPARLCEATKTLLGEMGFPEINPGAKVRALPISQCQIVEIARAEARRSPVILLDEPTSSLTESDKTKLYQLIRRLKTLGRLIVFVSHFLEEVREVADDIVILRDGERIVQGQMADYTDAQIVEHMVGRKVSDFFPRSSRVRGEVLLELELMTGLHRVPTEVTFDVCRGEVVGITGLNGAGRTELLRSIFGLRNVIAGSVRVKSNTGMAPHRHWRSGTGFVSEDRKTDGLAVQLSVAENMTMPTRSGVLNKPGALVASSRRWVTELNIKCQDPRQTVTSLSGGNQQKVAFARLLQADSDVFLLDEPTRGIDVGSKVELYRQIDTAALRGCAVLMASSYLPELLGICDRIVVMNRGRLVGIHDARSVESTTLMRESIA